MFLFCNTKHLDALITHGIFSLLLLIYQTNFIEKYVFLEEKLYLLIKK